MHLSTTSLRGKIVPSQSLLLRHRLLCIFPSRPSYYTLRSFWFSHQRFRNTNLAASMSTPTVNMSEEGLYKIFGNADSWSATAQEYKWLTTSATSTVTAGVLNGVVSLVDKLKPTSTATTILDDGCGVGNATQALIKTHGSKLPPTTKFIASDFSSGMVAATKELAAELAPTQPLWNNVDARVLDAQNLEGIADGSISHVVSNLCLMGVPDSRKALTEILRVLVPGGAFACSAPFHAPWFTLFDEPATKVRPDAKVGFNAGPHWSSVDGLTAHLQQAGFTDVEAQVVDMPMTLPPNPADFLNKFVRGNNPAVVAQFGGWSETELDRLVELALERLKVEYGEGIVKLVGKGVVGGGRK